MYRSWVEFLLRSANYPVQPLPLVYHVRWTVPSTLNPLPRRLFPLLRSGAFLPTKRGPDLLWSSETVYRNSFRKIHPPCRTRFHVFAVSGPGKVPILSSRLYNTPRTTPLHIPSRLHGSNLRSGVTVGFGDGNGKVDVTGRTYRDRTFPNTRGLKSRCSGSSGR